MYTHFHGAKIHLFCETTLILLGKMMSAVNMSSLSPEELRISILEKQKRAVNSLPFLLYKLLQPNFCGFT
jgi:hypothetical protein